MTGCRLEKSPGEQGGMECLCGIGCEREFPFDSQAKCEEKLKCKEYVCEKNHNEAFSKLLPNISAIPFQLINKD